MGETSQPKKTCAQSLASAAGHERTSTMANQANLSWREVVNKLDLAPHPEGGYFRQTYIKPANQESGTTPVATGIFFLITGDNFSTWHRVPHDEIFHFYGGLSVEISMINSKGELKTKILGQDFTNGETPQAVVPGGSWQALRIKSPDSDDSWALLGTTMAPGFEFQTFEIGRGADLAEEFPEHDLVIREFARE